MCCGGCADSWRLHVQSEEPDSEGSNSDNKHTLSTLEFIVRIMGTNTLNKVKASSPSGTASAAASVQGSEVPAAAAASGAQSPASCGAVQAAAAEVASSPASAKKRNVGTPASPSGAQRSPQHMCSATSPQASQK